MQCGSCRRPGGIQRLYDGAHITICDECFKSSFRTGRLVVLATGKDQPCDCGQNCAANRRAGVGT